MEKCLKPHTASQPAMLYFHGSALNIFCAPFFAGSHGKWAREREMERGKGEKRHKSKTRKKNRFSLKNYETFHVPSTHHPLAFICESLHSEGGSQEAQNTHSRIHFCILFASLLLSTAFFILNFLNAIALEVVTDCCTDFISFSPVFDHHHHHHGFIYYGSAKGATGYWRWRQSSKLHNRLLLIHC